MGAIDELLIEAYLSYDFWKIIIFKTLIFTFFWVFRIWFTTGIGILCFLDWVQKNVLLIDSIIFDIVYMKNKNFKNK